MKATLRTRVIALAVGTALLVILLAAVPIAVLLRSKAYAEADQEATYAAQSVADYLSYLGSAGRDDELLGPYLQRSDHRDDPAVSVVLPDGSRAGAPLPDDVARAVQGVRGPRLIDTDHDGDTLDEVSTPHWVSVSGGRAVVVFTRTPDGLVRAVATVRDRDVLARLARQLGVAAAIAAGLLLLAWAAAEVTGRRLVRPLQRTAQTAMALRDGDLSARAPLEGPEEVAAVAVELNALAARIGELLAQERESAADLSHQLRTPLTSVRLIAEGLPESPRRAELDAGLDRLERTLTQVIRSARRGVREGVHPGCDAVAVTADRVAFWRPLAEDQERGLEADLPDASIRVRCAAGDLGVALDALIENVVAHTEDGTAFRVCLRPTSYGAELVVSDDGPGIVAHALTRGSSDRGSTGLGMDIAASVARATGGSLELVELDEEGVAHGVALRLHHAEGENLRNP